MVDDRFTQIERQGGKYGNCTKGWPEFLQLNDDFQEKWPKYDRETCLFYCLQNAMALECGCTDSYEVQFSNNSAINRASQNYCDVTNRTESVCRQGEIQPQNVENTLCKRNVQFEAFAYNNNKSMSSSSIYFL